MTDRLDGARVGRVALAVTDLDAVTAFYRDVVGLAVLDRTTDAATLGAGDTPLLELRADEGLPERPRSAAGLYHVAFRFPSRGALADALDRVRDDWRLGGASDHGVSEALYLADPEGNGVELYRDRPRETWPVADGRVAMTTDPLALDALAADADGASDAPPGTDMGHVHLEPTDLAAAREFYVDALGLAVRQEFGADALFVASGDYHHHVGLNTWRGRTAPAEGRGLDWYELLVPTEAALDAAADRLVAAGYSVERTPNGLAVADPDGITLRLRVAE
ncbi:VOC family protein [Salarchaeum japonicum]|uniref:VOC family protein n=1 Tax=Salarchaeum japonicum TaxID=555573 RepID=A0AAV3T092_9EURY|nr:VOC family protein [Salarchaeum japonicum]